MRTREKPTTARRWQRRQVARVLRECAARVEIASERPAGTAPAVLGWEERRELQRVAARLVRLAEALEAPEAPPPEPAPPPAPEVQDISDLWAYLRTRRR